MPSMTVTMTVQQAQRVAAAFGMAHNLRDANGPRAATEVEVKAFTIAWMRGIVLDQERQAAARAAVDVNFDPT